MRRPGPRERPESDTASRRRHEETRIKNSLRSITTGYAGAVVEVGGLSVPLVRLASLGVALALIGGLHLLLARWRWGRAIRATPRTGRPPS